MGSKLWGGRFKEEIDREVFEFNASLRFDQRLYAFDIEGSIAHARMLGKVGILSPSESELLCNALKGLKEALDRGELEISNEYEDIHSLVEGELVAKVGDIGKKLHTARSRNDQVALDLRLYLREKIREVLTGLKDLKLNIVNLAKTHINTIMPGYTHLQRAQPVLLAQHLMAYYQMFKRDTQRFEEVLRRTNICPLGSGALAGSSLGIDRGYVAELLGMDGVCENSMDAVSDRDFAIEFASAAAIAMMHLSRLSEEIVLWNSQEFSFISIRDAFCTGSSLMPHKKNPDIPELIRAKTGRVYGHLIGLLTVMKGLPLTYNKDLQEDKEAIFDTSDTLISSIRLMARLIANLHFNEDTLKGAASKGYLVATDLLEYLVKKGASLREGHELVGRLVRYASEQEKELSELSLEELAGFSPLIEKDVYDWLDPMASVQRKDSLGGTSHAQVTEQILKAMRELGESWGD